MKRAELRETLSLYVDGELPASEVGEVERLLAESEEAREYLRELRRLRRHLRYEPADSPDVTRRVLAAIEKTRRRRPVRLRAVAAFVAGLAGGAVFVGLAFRQPTPVAVAEIPDQVLAAQSKVSSLTAQVQITEWGWHPQVPVRTFTGSIAYRAPESLWVEIRDDTVYPSEDWVPNHSTFVVDEDVAWSRAVAACPTEALPGCTPAEPRVLVTTQREPFPDAFPAPLDLIVPVASFSRAGEPELVGLREMDQRRAIGVEVTAAQVAALLDGLTSAGNWREVHPTDRVELWLDRDTLVPLAFTVFPAEGADRALWAIRHGYTDRVGDPILQVTWSNVILGDAKAVQFPRPPEDGDSLGFVDGPTPDLETLNPSVPEDMKTHRTGTVGTESGPAVSVASWSDGRAWLKMRWTSEWEARRLFGDLGPLVREVPVGSGVAYLNERGDRIGLHTEELDLVIQGSLPTKDLLQVVASLVVSSRQIPGDWAEAATSSLAEAVAAVDGLLLPDGLEGFAAPAVRVEPGIVTLAYAGPGNRAFLLTEAVDGELSPPLEANVRGVTVRGVDGRHSPDRGLLEWVEGDLTVSITSSTLSLEELVDIAESLDQP